MDSPPRPERTGAGRDHSITALFTVLVESDDLNDPIADAARSLLDGHIVLSRDMANRGHYPAIDPLQSVSRLRRDITTPEQVGHVEKVIELLSVYRDSEDLINIGAYSPGSNSRIDAAIAGIEYINAYLKQDGNLHSGFEQSQQELAALCQVLEAGTNGG